MADVIMPESTPCTFSKGWGGKCDKPTNNGMCTEHENAKCSSCGEPAIKSCAEGMGGLTCGASLCDKCTHNPEDAGGKLHVSKEDAKIFYEKKSEEDKAKKESRKSSIQRMNKELGVPVNLFELLKKPEGYTYMKMYYLDHTKRSGYPAVVDGEGKGRWILMENPLDLESVWRSIRPEYSTIRDVSVYYNRELGYAFIETEDNYVWQEMSEPIKVLTKEERDHLSEKEEKPFRWAYGLLCGSPSEESYGKIIDEKIADYRKRIEKVA